MSKYGDNNKFVKTILGGRNESEKGRRSYYGKVCNVGLMLDPVVLDPVEKILAFGKTEKEQLERTALINERLASTKWLRSFVEKHRENLAHVSLFVLHPGASITRHYGVTDAIIRCHIGVVPNPSALFYTAFDAPVTWERNRSFGFLDYHTPHWVTFNAGQAQNERIVLCVDVRTEYYEQYYPGHISSMIKELEVAGFHKSPKPV